MTNRFNANIIQIHRKHIKHTRIVGNESVAFLLIFKLPLEKKSFGVNSYKVGGEQSGCVRNIYDILKQCSAIIGGTDECAAALLTQQEEFHTVETV